MKPLTTTNMIGCLIIIMRQEHPWLSRYINFTRVGVLVHELLQREGYLP